MEIEMLWIVLCLYKVEAFPVKSRRKRIGETKKCLTDVIFWFLIE